MQPAPFSDAVNVQQLLDAMGVADYEPRVVNQLVDYLYRHVADVLQDAERIGEHTRRPPGSVATDDLMLAIRLRTTDSFAQPPSQEQLADIGREVNRQDVPAFPASRPGLLIPDEKECVTAQNYQLQLGADGTS